MNIEKLKGVIPDNVLLEIKIILPIANTPLRLAHLLSQASHESNGFKATVENLNYSAKGLRTTFPKYFPTDALALQYERKPEAIANRVYANRMGNGDEKSGDGYKYRGRGYLQTTGKANQVLFDATVPDDIIKNPELISTKYSLTSAIFFFTSNKLWDICDKGSTNDIITQLTKRINGGTIGLTERITLFKKFYALLV